MNHGIWARIKIEAVIAEEGDAMHLEDLLQILKIKDIAVPE